MLLGKKIILGVCGSIAAYKSALIVRLLKKQGAEVKVVMTASATTFITPLTLSTLSEFPVYQEFQNGESGEWTNHVALGLWADHILIAPASAHTIGKLANGICDNLLSAVYLSARCPVTIAPAMDLDMYAHPSVQENLQKLKSFGNFIVDPDSGELASGLVGKGRMAEPEALVKVLEGFFRINTLLSGYKVLITAGPTYEPIDPVRFIGNRSSGKMGYSIAERATAMGAEVVLISGPTYLKPPIPLSKFIKVETASEMNHEVEKYFDKSDIVIYAAAVADYSPKFFHTEKIKKAGNELNLELIKTIDIAGNFGLRKHDKQYVIGFALETENEFDNAKAKRRAKNFDLIVLNSTKDAGATFGFDTNKITIIKSDDSVIHFGLKPKIEVADDILQTLLKMINVQP